LLNKEGKVLRESTVATFGMYTDASAVGYGGYLTMNNVETQQFALDAVLIVSSLTSVDLGKIDTLLWASELPEYMRLCLPPEVGESGVDKPTGVKVGCLNQIPGGESEGALSPEVDNAFGAQRKEPGSWIFPEVDICREKILGSESNGLCPEVHSGVVTL